MCTVRRIHTGLNWRLESVYQRWETRRRERYEQVIHLVARDPYQALFGASNRWLSGSHDASMPGQDLSIDPITLRKRPRLKDEERRGTSIDHEKASIVKTTVLKYPTADDTREDVDLLRASDVRARAGLQSQRPKASPKVQETRRTKLEANFDKHQCRSDPIQSTDELRPKTSSWAKGQRQRLEKAQVEKDEERGQDQLVEEIRSQRESRQDHKQSLDLLQGEGDMARNVHLFANRVRQCDALSPTSKQTLQQIYAETYERPSSLQHTRCDEVNLDAGRLLPIEKSLSHELRALQFVLDESKQQLDGEVDEARIRMIKNKASHAITNCSRRIITAGHSLLAHSHQEKSGKTKSQASISATVYLLAGVILVSGSAWEFWSRTMPLPLVQNQREMELEHPPTIVAPDSVPMDMPQEPRQSFSLWAS